MQLIAVLLVSVASPMANAGCSRPLEVPLSPIGFSVKLNGEKASGVFVEFIRQVADSVGCQLRMHPVPRARLEFMFEKGEADVILAATQSEKRDQSGLFIPLVRSRAVMVSLKGSRPAIHSLAELIATPGLRVAVVRGYDYGPSYQRAVEQLERQHRLFQEKDPLEIARLLKAKMVDATIMPASTLYGAAVVDSRVADITTKLRIEPLEEMPWHLGGLYLSHKLPEADRAALEKAIQAANRNHALLNAYRRYYPAELVAVTTRAL